MAAIIQYALEPHRATIVRLTSATLSIGRHQDCTIRLGDRSVRPKHAQIFEHRGQYWIHALEGDDLVVNGEAVNTHPLRHLDKVRCGDVVLEFYQE